MPQDNKLSFDFDYDSYLRNKEAIEVIFNNTMKLTEGSTVKLNYSIAIDNFQQQLNKLRRCAEIAEDEGVGFEVQIDEDFLSLLKELQFIFDDLIYLNNKRRDNDC